MASKYEESLSELALEPDEDKRLEMAASIDRDVSVLDERWENRDVYATLEAERDSLIVERDEWKKRYADRFFDSGEGETTPAKAISAHEDDVKKESQPRGYAALWNDRVN